MSTLAFGSLFSGMGGLDMGVSMALESLGHATRTAWVSDIEPGPCKVLAARFPHAPNLGDITAVDWEQVEPVDILAGGFPCQDVSTAGRRAGMKDGTRSGLWAMMADAIQHLQPRMVVIENVPGLLSAHADSDVEPCPWCLGEHERDGAMRALGAVLADLATLGYDAQWTSIRASDVGACHRRERVFILAHPQGSPWSISDRNGGDDAYSHGGRFLKCHQGLRCVPITNADGNESLELLPTPSVADTQGGRKTRSGDRSHELLLNGIAAEERFAQYAPAIAYWETVTGRAAPSPTEPTGQGGTPRLSARFVEWMMGLPEGHVTALDGLSHVQQLRLLGNGVVPLQAAHAVLQLLDMARIEVAA